METKVKMPMGVAHRKSVCAGYPPSRFEKFGLVLHPEKTRLVDFRRPRRSPRGEEEGPGTCDSPGFTHHWARSRRGNGVIKRRTAKDRFSRALHRVREWCRLHRHDPVGEQHRALRQKLRGHYAYYGITSNIDALQRFYWEVIGIWRKWLSSRSRDGHFSWSRWRALLQRLPLPAPRIVHQYTT
jgi:RNA-directed DNA polymerase